MAYKDKILAKITHIPINSSSLIKAIIKVSWKKKIRIKKVQSITFHKLLLASFSASFSPTKD